MGIAYDEDRIDAIAEEVAEAIEQAGYGNLPWITVAERLSNAFPGSFAAIANQDFANDAVMFFEYANLEDVFAQTYVSHYAHINPWCEIIASIRSGIAYTAEESMPARMIKDTEFYNDWLYPQGNFEGACNIKIEASPNDIIYFPIHYPLRFAASYDRPAAHVLQRLGGPLTRAITGGLERT